MILPTIVTALRTKINAYFLYVLWLSYTVCGLRIDKKIVRL